MFKPQAGSIGAVLVSDITSSATEIAVDDVSVLPDPPNLLTMFNRNSFETIMYEGIDETNNLIQQITRGVEGTAQTWPADQEIARNFTAMDLKTIHSLITELYYDSSYTKDEGQVLSEATPQHYYVDEGQVLSEATPQHYYVDEGQVLSETTLT